MTEAPNQQEPEKESVEEPQVLDAGESVEEPVADVPEQDDSIKPVTIRLVVYPEVPTNEDVKPIFSMETNVVLPKGTIIWLSKPHKGIKARVLYSGAHIGEDGRVQLLSIGAVVVQPNEVVGYDVSMDKRISGSEDELG